MSSAWPRQRLDLQLGSCGPARPGKSLAATMLIVSVRYLGFGHHGGPFHLPVDHRPPTGQWEVASVYSTSVADSLYAGYRSYMRKAKPKAQQKEPTSYLLMGNKVLRGTTGEERGTNKKNPIHGET